jgi:hypothetical protein
VGVCRDYQAGRCPMRRIVVTSIATGQTRPKGNGGDVGAHHKVTMNGKPLARLKDGCDKRATCVGCEIPIEKCRG